MCIGDTGRVLAFVLAFIQFRLLIVTWWTLSSNDAYMSTLGEAWIAIIIPFGKLCRLTN
jgi:hypothetical protein